MHSSTLVHAQTPTDDPVTSRVEALVQRLEGVAERDEKAPGKPLVTVRFNTTRVTDEQLGELRPLTSLKHLELTETHISDAGLSHLRGHTGLRVLYLYQTKLTDQGLEQIAAIPGLEDLMLGPYALSEKGLAHLAALKQLKILRIGNSELSDSLMATIGKLEQIEHLELISVNLTDASLAHLRGLPRLRRLSLSRNPITDAGLAHLSSLTHLEFLGLSQTKISDAGLAHLKGLSKLKTLQHDETRVTAAGLAVLTQLAPDQKTASPEKSAIPAVVRDRAVVTVKDVDTTQIREAVRKAVGPIQKTLVTYADKRDCYSCHHQGVPLFALAKARSRGLLIDNEVFTAAVALTRADLENGRGLYERGKGQPGGIDRAGYALWTLDVGGQAPDKLTSLVSNYIEQTDPNLGHWRPSAQRPPIEASRFTATALALRGLMVFGSGEDRQAADARVAKALEWLRKTPPVDTEDRVFRLWGLKYAGAKPEELRAAAKDLLATQRSDGGWSQTEKLSSDAYATGSALVALHEAADMPTDDPAYRRGAAYLVATQKEDGTWFVATRTRPFQVYFESGFPYAKDQFISSTASGWAASALALALPAK